MIGPHITICGTIETLSPLHVGTGEVVELPRRQGDNETTEVALVALDYRGRPYLPGSSIKGIMRSLLAGNIAQQESLFGPETIEDQENAFAGSVIIWNARLETEQPLPELTHVPRQDVSHARFQNETLGSRGLFVDARTAIDPKTGVADDRKLFHQMLVAPNTKFKFEACIDAKRASSEEAAILGKLLAHMMADDGISVGKSSRIGHGRIRLSELYNVHAIPSVDECNAGIWELLNNIQPGSLARSSVCSSRLTLTCDGPYLVADSAMARKPTKVEEQSKEPHLSPLVEGDGTRPRLPGATLIGALRNRALWLERLVDPEARDRRDHVHEWRDGAGRLERVERLFGVAGWRGLVKVDRIEFTGTPQPLEMASQDITSVKIDRFSAAPIDGGLYTTRAWLAPRFEVSLVLEDRKNVLDESDRALFQRLVKSLHEDGLMLGHGTSKGYGWFIVQETDQVGERTA